MTEGAISLVTGPYRSIGRGAEDARTLTVDCHRRVGECELCSDGVEDVEVVVLPPASVSKVNVTENGVPKLNDTGSVVAYAFRLSGPKSPS